ncbi:hypothetical protein JOM56_011158 [Amanita muscaria]
MSSTNHTLVGWEREVSGRGTWSILASCLATLFLCIHTTLHLNVPPKEAGKLWRFRNKLKWVLMGMFAPELVMFAAWSQWMSARKLTKKVNQYIDKQDGSNQFKWTMTHSHYAQMGGFVIDTNDPAEDQYIPDSPRLFLTANGVATLAEMGHLPAISAEIILDKSKTDSLGKAIVIGQALWLIVQCFERLMAGLHLVPLERNTVAHAACALVMYYFWWEKPVNIRFPIVLSGPWYRPVVAAMWMFSHTSTNKDYHAWDSSMLSPEIESLLHIERAPDVTPTKDTTYGVAANDIAIEMESMPILSSYGIDAPRHDDNPDVRLLTISLNGVSNNQSPEPHPKMRMELLEGEFLLPFGFGPKASSKSFQTANIARAKSPKYFAFDVATTVDNITLARWRLAHQCLKGYPEIWGRYKKGVRTIVRDGELWVISEYPDKLCFVDLEISNWPRTGLIRPEKSYISVLFFSIFVMLYGGIMATAWNLYFPTQTESTLWRISSVYISFSGILYAFTEAFSSIATWITAIIGYSDSNQGFLRRWFRRLRYLFVKILEFHIWIAFLGAVCLYIVARIFIMVEIFISLRSQPSVAYETPDFSQYLPHI